MRIKTSSVALLVCLTACDVSLTEPLAQNGFGLGGGGGGYDAGTFSPTLTPGDRLIVVGDTVSIHLRRHRDDTPVGWRSSTASVSLAGYSASKVGDISTAHVTARGERAGLSQVSASFGNSKMALTIEVISISDVGSTWISAGSSTIEVGASTTISATVTDVTGRSVHSPAVFSVNDPAVAEIRREYVEYLGAWRTILVGLKAGRTMVTAELGNAKHSIEVTVTQ